MTHEEFLIAAKERFEDKVVCAPITVKDAEKFPWTQEEIDAYPAQAWVADGECPVCGTKLEGLFGSFQWGLIHGIGHCSNCKRIDFRYYHYIAEGKQPLKAFAVSAF